jgi:competence protein ComEC
MRELIPYALIGGFSVGIFIAAVYAQWEIDVWFFILLGTALLVVATRRRSLFSTRYVVLSALFLLAFAAGYWRTELYADSLESDSFRHQETEVTFEAVVIREPDEREMSKLLYVSTGEIDVLVIVDRFQKVAYGDRLLVVGRLETPTSFETDLGRTFDYRGYLNAQGVTYMVRYGEIEVLASGQGSPLIASLLTFKSFFLESIENGLPEPQAGLAQGLLLGVKRALGDELEQAFRSTGIIHIVVLSGYNIMLVVAFTLYILSFVFPWRGRLLFGLLAIVAFALMVGLSATVVRASIMAALALIARSFGRTYAVIRALLFAGMLMLILNPYLLVYDTGFQLSFMATLGLILVSPHLEQTLRRVPAIVGVREFLVATLATQLFVLPILLYQIGEFSVVSVMVNVLVLPMVPVAMLATFLMVVTGLVWSVLSLPLVWLAYGALTYIVMVPTFFASLPFASFVVPSFPFWVVVLSYGVIGYGLYRLYRPSELLQGWVIEDEEVFVQNRNTSANTSTTETPVFFR